MSAAKEEREAARAPRRRGRRALSFWLPEAAADLALRRAGPTGFGAAPLVILADQGAARIVVGLSPEAERLGLRRGATAADARALHPSLVSRPLDPQLLARFAEGLRRWSERYSPWVGPPEIGGAAAAPDSGARGPRSDVSIALDVTGCAHLFGGEAALLEDLLARLARFGFRARGAIAGSKGAAWALARFGAETEGPLIAAPGALRARLADLPPAALRLPQETIDGLARLGLRRIEDVAAIPRAALARRFGAPLRRRLDQAFGIEPEPISPPAQPFRAALRLSFPEPIGFLDDLQAGLARLLAQMAARLEAHGLGARRLLLELRRVDRASLPLEISLARPSRDPEQMRRLFARGLEEADAGFGIDGMRLVALETERWTATQQDAFSAAEAPGALQRLGDAHNPALAELLGRLGGRVGFDRMRVYAPSASRLPEKAFHFRSAAETSTGAPSDWRAAAAARPPRPLIGFAPEPIEALTPGARRRPPDRFRWRRVEHRLAAAFGPERVAPEWWLDDPAWRGGARDYWRVETEQGARLWLFRLAQSAEEVWFATGRFM